MSSAFKVFINGKAHDYRTPDKIDKEQAVSFFSKRFSSVSLPEFSSGRHFSAIAKKGDKKVFIKLSLSKGMNVLLKNEAEWNRQFNSFSQGKDLPFSVPNTIETGWFDSYFYLVTDFFEGELLESHTNTFNCGKIRKSLDVITELCEFIQQNKFTNIHRADTVSLDPHEKFLEKTNIWLEAVPNNVRHEYFSLNEMVKIVKAGYGKLQIKPRHGDFTPWHMIDLGQGRIGLIDGEHALSEGVEQYDMAYFVQRVFSVLSEVELAGEITSTLLRRGYEKESFRTVLAARAIGGFLDESLSEKSDYEIHEKFSKFVLSI